MSTQENRKAIHTVIFCLLSDGTSREVIPNLKYSLIRPAGLGERCTTWRKSGDDKSGSYPKFHFSEHHP